MFIRKTILIQKSSEEIFSLINDFKQWSKWSPWLISDPKTELSFENNKKYYTWKSEIIGSGNMQILSEEDNQSVSCILNFTAPWKSKALIDIFLNKKQEGTEVVWTMKSKLPFYLKWMKKSMKIDIEMDYKRGLLLLKDYAEHGKVFSTLSKNQFKNIEKTNYLGFTRKCSFEAFERLMTSDFQKIIPYVMKNHKEEVSGSPFTLYQKFDPVNNKVKYTIGVPVSKLLKKIDNEYFIGNLPKMRVHSILHTGKYHHVANAWSTQIMYQRSKKFKSKKSLPPFEIYLNSPTNTHENALETEVLFPVH